jgi:hypothetical protein
LCVLQVAGEKQINDERTTRASAFPIQTFLRTKRAVVCARACQQAAGVLQYTVTLACGHTLTLTADKLKQQQLYIGKKIARGELHPQNS